MSDWTQLDRLTGALLLSAGGIKIVEVTQYVRVNTQWKDPA